VYTLTNVPFSYGDTTEEPYGENKNVVVHIDIEPWIPQEIFWDND
jgi:hypothetical protein